MKQIVGSGSRPELMSRCTAFPSVLIKSSLKCWNSGKNFRHLYHLEKGRLSCPSVCRPKSPYLSDWGSWSIRQPDLADVLIWWIRSPSDFINTFLRLSAVSLGTALFYTLLPILFLWLCIGVIGSLQVVQRVFASLDDKAGEGDILILNRCFYFVN